MADLRDLLEQERRRFRMRDDSFGGLERLRRRRHRNRRIASGVVALVIAAAGIGGGVYAFRDTGGRPGDGPTPSVSPEPSVGPTSTPSPSVSPTPSVGAVGPVAPATSGRLLFLDELHGFAVDPEGRVFASTDGGVSWSPLDPGPGRVTSVDFVDLTNGWALKAKSLWRTTDGGSTWTQAGEPAQPLQVVQFLTPQVGWGVSGDITDPSATTQLVRTDDGGESWRDVEIPAPAGPRSVCFVNGSSGWASAGPRLYWTEDGARTWSTTSLPGLSDADLWTPTLACSGEGSEAFVLLGDGAATGHEAFVAYQVVRDDRGAVTARPLLQESFTSPLRGVPDVYDDPDAYPGVFTMVRPGLAYFMNWCPACSDPSTFVVKTGGNPAKVIGRFPVGSVAGPAEPLGLSFVTPMHGWALLSVGGSTRAEATIVETSDGGKTWVGPCQGVPSPCFGPQAAPSP